MDSPNRKHNSGGIEGTGRECGAKTRAGALCMEPAMRNPKTGRCIRCRVHGGASTGPRTSEGLERCRQAAWKHGRRSAKAIALRRVEREKERQLTQDLREMIKALTRDLGRLEKPA